MPESDIKNNKNGLAMAALILGIVAFVLAFIPFVNFLAGAVALVGLVLGIIGITKHTKRGIAIAGTIISIVAGIVSIVMVLAYTAIFFGALGQAVDESNKDMSTPVQVTYQVDGTATDASITYYTYANGNSGSEQLTGQTLPFTKTVTGTKGWSSYSVSATNGFDDDTDISCKITVDGKVVASQNGHGKFASVYCSGSGN